MYCCALAELLPVSQCHKGAEVLQLPSVVGCWRDSARCGAWTRLPFHHKHPGRVENLSQIWKSSLVEKRGFRLCADHVIWLAGRKMKSADVSFRPELSYHMSTLSFETGVLGIMWRGAGWLSERLEMCQSSHQLTGSCCPSQLVVDFLHAQCRAFNCRLPPHSVLGSVCSRGSS